jgi:hypothetical protein
LFHESITRFEPPLAVTVGASNSYNVGFTVAVAAGVAVAVGVGVAIEAAPPLAVPGVPVPPSFSVLAAACTGTIVTKSANVRQPAMHFIHVFFFMYVASLKFDDLTITQEFVRQMKKQCHFFDIIKEML